MVLSYCKPATPRVIITSSQFSSYVVEVAVSIGAVIVEPLEALKLCYTDMLLSQCLPRCWSLSCCYSLDLTQTLPLPLTRCLCPYNAIFSGCTPYAKPRNGNSTTTGWSRGCKPARLAESCTPFIRKDTDWCMYCR